MTAISQKRKSSKKRAFNQTKIGFIIEHAAPTEYHLINVVGGANPHINLIEALSYASLNPIFRSQEFHEALMEYREYGLYPPDIIKSNARIEMKYIDFRRRLYSSH